MPHRFFQVVTIFLALILVSSLSLAGGYFYSADQDPGPKVDMTDSAYYSHADQAKYGGTNPVYLFGGMTFSHKLYRGKRTVTRLALTPVTYEPEKRAPDTFIGFQAGIGKTFDQQYDLQVSFIRELSEEKNTTLNGSGANILINMKAIKLEMGYIFNPGDPFQIIGQAGVEVGEFQNQLTLAGLIYSPTEETRVLPNFGAELVYYFTPSFAFRTHLEYTLDAEGEIYDGESFGALLGLSYNLT